MSHNLYASPITTFLSLIYVCAKTEDCFQSNDRAYGVLPTNKTHHIPGENDATVIDGVLESIQQAHKGPINFPYVSEIPASEHDEDLELFCLGFPWLFLFSIGDY